MDPLYFSAALETIRVVSGNVVTKVKEVIYKRYQLIIKRNDSAIFILDEDVLRAE